MTLEHRVQEIGRELIAEAKEHVPSLISSAGRKNVLFNICMANPDTATQLFQFLEVFPVLSDERVLIHSKEYLIDSGVELGPFLGPLVRTAELSRATNIKPELAVGKIREVATEMAESFIAGRTIDEAIKRVGIRDATYDVLGEVTTSDAGANFYAQAYLKTLNALAEYHGVGATDRFGNPKINLSVKLSAFDPHLSPLDPQGASRRIWERFEPIMSRAKEVGALINWDMEHEQSCDLTTDMFMDYFGKGEFKNYPHVGIVAQAYLKRSDTIIKNLIKWGQKRGTPFWMRLVKGANWDYEIKVAVQNGWEIPVFTRKTDTDIRFEELAKVIMGHSDIVYGAYGTHNLRSRAVVLALAEKYGVDSSKFESQTLFGMGEESKSSFLQRGIGEREYTPFGEMIPGMGYFVRRLLENSSNTSFVRKFDKNADPEMLLRDPRLEPTDAVSRRKWFRGFSVARRNKLSKPEERVIAASGTFHNYPVANFALPETRQAADEAIIRIGVRAGSFEAQLYIDGKYRSARTDHPSHNPSQPSQVLGRVAVGSDVEVGDAISAAKKAFNSWRNIPVKDRAALLDRVADLKHRRHHDLAALLTHEIAKPRAEAYGEVEEAIDFDHFYADCMRGLGKERLTQDVPAERNTTQYVPLGVASTIGPFNFPLAILGGMTAAALVAGNTVVMKPAPDAPLIGAEIMKMYIEAGIPPGVLNYVFCEDHDASQLVESPDVNLIAFTGSERIGKQISEQAGLFHTKQHHFKHCVIETGGKNPIIIDDTADIEQSVLSVVKSAFGYAGQKCSANSITIVLDSVYDQFVAKLVDAAQSLRVDDARLVDTDVPALINEKSFLKVKKSIAQAEKEGGKYLLQGAIEDDGGYYVSPTIMEITPDNILAREEFFAPVLGIIKASSFEKAIDLANAARFGLTAGVYSRTPSHLEYAQQHLKHGNIYFNRAITGAVVGRQPFGGYFMSGAGTKAGGEDYLLQFMRPVVCSVNESRGSIRDIERFLR